MEIWDEDFWREVDQLATECVDPDEGESDHEHRLMNSPAMAAHMVKGDDEVIISGYGSPRMVVLNYPARTAPTGELLHGVIRDIPVGPRRAIHEIFADEVLRHERENWSHAKGGVTR